MLKVFPKMALVLSIIAGFIFIVGVKTANGAPQEASMSAMALCIAVIPYIFVRLLYESKALKDRAKLIELLEKTPTPN